MDDEQIENLQNGVFPVYVLEMDIRENMGYLKRRAGECLNLDLSEVTVWVLSQRRVADYETLEELCGSYVGIVQIQFLVIFNEGTGDQKLEILDVLQANEDHTNNMDIDTENTDIYVENSSRSQSNEKLKNSEWVASSVFRSIQKENRIPKDPKLWSSSHVSKWLTWAKHHFRLKNLNPRNLTLDGRTLCNLGVEQFRLLVPCDPGDIFYMHFEILRKTHTVAIVFKSGERSDGRSSPLLNKKPKDISHERVNPKCNLSTRSPPPSTSTASTTAETTSQNMQLWQFLLQLLTDPKNIDVISWCGSNGEFKFHQPDLVAKLWGKHKGKNNMNYDKLSRALRYYYAADKMINKVSGMSYVYKFEMDLRSVLGYDSLQLQQQMAQAQQQRSSTQFSLSSDAG